MWHAQSLEGSAQQKVKIRWWYRRFFFVLCGTMQRPKVPIFVFVPLLAQEPSNLDPKEAELPLRLTFKREMYYFLPVNMTNNCHILSTKLSVDGVPPVTCPYSDRKTVILRRKTMSYLLITQGNLNHFFLFPLVNHCHK